MSLSIQAQIYSLETDAFYTDEEFQIANRLEELRKYLRLLYKEINIITEYRKNILIECNTDKIKKNAIDKMTRLSMEKERLACKNTNNKILSEEDRIHNILNGFKNTHGTKYSSTKTADELLDFDSENSLERLQGEGKELKERIKETKIIFEETLERNKQTRAIRPTHLNYKNIVSIFDSSLIRTLGMKYNKLNQDLMIISVFYFKIAEDIVLNGFLCNGEKYIYLFSSAGQLRNKKMVFIKESLWNKYHQTLLCGLSIEKINSFGGINRNKYLAYSSLVSTSTDEIPNRI